MNKSKAALLALLLCGCQSPAPKPVASNEVLERFLNRPPEPVPPRVLEQPQDSAYYTNAAGKAVLNIPLTRNRDAFFTSHPGLDPKKVEAIEWGKVILGMTREETYASWGSPNSRQVTDTGAGTMEIWSYSSGKGAVFKNDKLISFTE